MQLHWLDWVFIAVPCTVIFAVTFFMRKYLRSVADYLAASRCAGRYVICTAAQEAGQGVSNNIAGWEQFSRVGWGLSFWQGFTSIIYFVLGLTGFVSFRFRETRCLTFHQFVEIRYSRSLRIFASFINVFSGLFNFGLVPAIGARFFVVFVGLPYRMAFYPGTFHFAGVTPGADLPAGFHVSMDTFIPIMLLLMSISLVMAMTGGQISVMVTDCLEGMISGALYLFVAFAVLSIISFKQIGVAMCSAKPGEGLSFVDPYDIWAHTDFGVVFIFLGLAMGMYYFRGNTYNQGFAAAAKDAHEGRMAGIIGNWRGYAGGAMFGLCGLAAFTLLHHPDFIKHKDAITAGLQNIPEAQKQLRTQMTMPMALGETLSMAIPGVKGAFIAIIVFGVLATQGASLHQFGNTFFQDVVLPFSQACGLQHFKPRTQILSLRLCALFVGSFACFFGIIYTPQEYLIMLTSLIGAIYLGGMGVISLGGLYWKRGTNIGAWTCMVVGVSLSMVFNVLSFGWNKGFRSMADHLFTSPWAQSILHRRGDQFPVHGLWLSFYVAAACTITYFLVSLLTCREPFNMDKMLHRGKYKLEGETKNVKKGTWLARFLCVDEHYSKGDKFITYFTFWYSMAWKAMALGIVFWVFGFGRLKNTWWFHYHLYTGLMLAIPLGVVTTIWFTWGGTIDLIRLFRTLRTIKRNDADDGTVRDHHITAEEVPAPAAVAAGDEDEEGAVAQTK